MPRRRDCSDGIVNTVNVRPTYADTAAKGRSDGVVMKTQQDNNRIVLNNSYRVVGKASFAHLKAAPRAPKDTTPLAVFCVSNISTGYDVEDICNHCLDIGVRTRFVFDISRSNWMGKAFKVAIGASDLLKFQDEDSWPEGVSIRAWRPYNSHFPATVADNSAQLFSRPSDSDVLDENINVCYSMTNIDRVNSDEIRPNTEINNDSVEILAFNSKDADVKSTVINKENTSEKTMAEYDPTVLLDSVELETETDRPSKDVAMDSTTDSVDCHVNEESASVSNLIAMSYNVLNG
jgi:hypothetical protein